MLYFENRDRLPAIEPQRKRKLFVTSYKEISDSIIEKAKQFNFNKNGSKIQQ